MRGDLYRGKTIASRGINTKVLDLGELGKYIMLASSQLWHHQIFYVRLNSDILSVAYTQFQLSYQVGGH